MATTTVVTLGGRRVPVSRPRVRTADDEHELPLASYRHFADRDPLSEVVFERMLAGVSTRRYEQTGEPVGTEVDEQARSTSKSAVSREFVPRTREHLIELMSRPLEDLRLAALMLDGISSRAAAASSRWGSTPTGSSIRSACGMARPRTPRSPRRC